MKRSAWTVWMVVFTVVCILMVAAATDGARYGARAPSRSWTVEHYDDAEMNVRCYVLLSAASRREGGISCVAYDPPEWPSQEEAR